MENIQNRKFDNIPLGFMVRRSIGKALTFRIRRGNGACGSQVGKLYQDRYTYFVPTSINNTNGQPARNALSSAVAAWKSMSPAEREPYNYAAGHRQLHMSGYNLFVREYILENT